MTRTTRTMACVLAFASIAFADKANVLKVTAYARTTKPAPTSWTFVVTTRHNDRGTKHFCDAIRVTDTKGKVLRKQTIKRPMCPYGRKPFELPIPGVRATSRVVVEAHCKVDGWGGEKVTVDLTQTEGAKFKVVKGAALQSYINGLVADLGKPGTKAQVEAMKKKDQLAQLGPVVVPALIEGAKAKQPESRWWSLQVLGQVGGKEAIEPLLAAFKDKNGTVRAVAVRATGRFLRDPRVREAMFQQMAGGARKHATEILLRNRGTRAQAIQKLGEMLEHPNPGARAFAFEQLMPIDKGASKDAAVRAIKTAQNVKVRSAALEYLKACKDNRPTTIEAMKGLMESREPQTRGEAFLAIITVDPKVGYETGIQALATEEDGKAFRFILGKMFKCPARDKRLIDICLAGLRSDDKKNRNLCGKALPYLTHQRITYYWDAIPEFRAKQAANWEKWWAENRATFKMPPLR